MYYLINVKLIDWLTKKALILIFSKIKLHNTKPEEKIKIKNGSGRLPLCVLYNTGKDLHHQKQSVLF